MISFTRKMINFFYSFQLYKFLLYFKMPGLPEPDGRHQMKDGAPGGCLRAKFNDLHQNLFTGSRRKRSGVLRGAA